MLFLEKSSKNCFCDPQLTTQSGQNVFLSFALNQRIFIQRLKRKKKKKKKKKKEESRHSLFFKKAIEKFRNPILWIANQKDGKSDIDSFVAKSAIGSLVTVPGNKHSYASPRLIPIIVAAIDSWVDSNKVFPFVSFFFLSCLKQEYRLD